MTGFTRSELFDLHRLRLKARWQTGWLFRKYRVRFEPRYEPTGRIVNGCYAEVRRVAL